MADFKGQINPTGYVKMLQIMMDRLITKKTVAQFEDLKSAEDQCLLELSVSMDNDTHEALNQSWNHFKEMVDLPDWWDSIGKH